MLIFSQPEIEARIDQFLEKNPNGVIEILGPTASGKTGYSIDLAERLAPAEILCVDSRQVFEECDVSSAKITAEEARGVPHHGLDLVDLDTPYNVVQFQKYAFETIETILEKKSRPILCGGTMLWLDAVSENYQFTDDPTEKSVERGDPLWPFLKIGLHWERDKLYRRVDLRSVQQFEGGMIEETERLIARGMIRQALTSFGYQEIAAALAGEITMNEALLLNQKRNRNYAKRQLTWWRGRDDVLWVDAQTLGRKF